MPNHVKNILEFVGSETEISKLKETISGYNEEEDIDMEIDFERIIPMPQDADWFHWRVDNWGTKWNAYEQEETIGNKMIFNTAWCPPTPVIDKLATMFPTLKITHRWASEDIGHCCGKRVYQNGAIKTERPKADGLPKDVAYAKKIWREAGDDCWS